MDSHLYSKHNLGLLIAIINQCTIRSNEIKNSIAIIENALYLLWTHFNIYFSMSDHKFELMEQLENLKSQAETILNDAFFAKIQSLCQKNIFVDALCRRIKRIVYLKQTNNLLKL